MIVSLNNGNDLRRAKVEVSRLRRLRKRLISTGVMEKPPSEDGSADFTSADEFSDSSHMSEVKYIIYFYNIEVL